MTIVLTIGSPSGVLMAADSAVTLDFGTVREYETAQKLWQIPGVGFVSTWGGLTGNTIGQHLGSEWREAKGRTVSGLARSVHDYLVSDFRPDEHGLEDVGYHIAGIYPDGAPAVFHSYFNVSRIPNAIGNYDLQVIGPRAGTTFLYNGRNDLAHPLIDALINEARTGQDPQFRGESLPELAHLAHFLLRVITEITPSVSAPYTICGKHKGGREIVRTYAQSIVPLERFRTDFEVEQQTTLEELTATTTPSHLG